MFRAINVATAGKFLAAAAYAVSNAMMGAPPTFPSVCLSPHGSGRHVLRACH